MMKRLVWAVVAAVVTAGALQVSAQQQAPDPRVGLKAGLTDAGQAAKNMDYSPSALQVIQLKYNSAHCNYGVTIPATADDLFFDGFESQDTVAWSLTVGDS